MSRPGIVLASALLSTACAGSRSGATEPPRRATAAECKRLAEHAVALFEAELSAQGHEGSASVAARTQHATVLSACREHGDAVAVACMLSARHPDELRRCEDLDPQLEPRPLAETQRPDRATCSTFADHVVGLMRDDLEARQLDPSAADAEHPRLLDVCLGEASLAEAECGLSATTLAELEQC